MLRECWQADAGSSVLVSGMVKPTTRGAVRIAGKAARDLPPPTQPNPVQKAKERPASKGRVHKGRTHH